MLTCWVPSPPVLCTSSTHPYAPTLVSKVAGAQETQAVTRTGCIWTLWVKSSGHCHYSVLPAAGAGTEGAAQQRADVTSRPWVCGLSKCPPEPSNLWFLRVARNHIRVFEECTTFTPIRPPLPPTPHTNTTHTCSPHNFQNHSPILPPSPMQLPLPVCMNLWTWGLKGSPSAHPHQGVWEAVRSSGSWR